MQERPLCQEDNVTMLTNYEIWTLWQEYKLLEVDNTAGIHYHFTYNLLKVANMAKIHYKTYSLLTADNRRRI